VSAPLLGVDLGGTKIAGVLLSRAGETLAEARIPTPREDYAATLAAISGLAGQLDTTGLPLGLGIPGAISPATGCVHNANSTWLNGRPLLADLERETGRQVRIANDANCFAVSEASDGAAAGAACVFGVILGTGCGGGIALGGHAVFGRHGVAGEWGHTPLPWPDRDEIAAAPRCWCGRRGCMETWVSGPALAADHARVTGTALTAEAIAAAAATGDGAARATLERHASRLARGLAVVCDILDPDVIVLGGGLSSLAHLYGMLPGQIAPHLFSDHCRADIRPPRFGAASGVRGAARLWA
jgi:fructokinase